MNFMRSDGRIDAGKASGSEPPRRLSGAGLAESVDGRARRIVRAIGGGAETLAEAFVVGIVGASGANIVSRSGRAALRSRRRVRRYCPGRSAVTADGSAEFPGERRAKRGRESDPASVRDFVESLCPVSKGHERSIACGVVDSLT